MQSFIALYEHVPGDLAIAAWLHCQVQHVLFFCPMQSPETRTVQMLSPRVAYFNAGFNTPQKDPTLTRSVET